MNFYCLPRRVKGHPLNGVEMGNAKSKSSSSTVEDKENQTKQGLRFPARMQSLRKSLRLTKKTNKSEIVQEKNVDHIPAVASGSSTTPDEEPKSSSTVNEPENKTENALVEFANEINLWKSSFNEQLGSTQQVVLHALLFHQQSGKTLLGQSESFQPTNKQLVILVQALKNPSSMNEDSLWLGEQRFQYSQGAPGKYLEAREISADMGEELEEVLIAYVGQDFALLGISEKNKREKGHNLLKECINSFQNFGLN